jgi:hypothetical protein
MNRNITLASVVSAVQEQVACEVAGDLVILNMRNGQYFGLNSVGAKIWGMLDESREVRAIRDLLLDAYPEVEPEVCTTDLLELLVELVDAELVEIT